MVFSATSALTRSAVPTGTVDFVTITLGPSIWAPTARAALHRRHVGLAIRAGGSADGEEDDAASVLDRHLEIGGECQAAFGKILGDERRQTRFVKRDHSRDEAADPLDVVVHAHDGVAGLSARHAPVTNPTYPDPMIVIRI